MENKYYSEIKIILSSLISKKKYEEALKIINEELSMPYIPLEFEDFLLESLEKIPLSDSESNFTLSLEKIIDLLLKLDKSKNDFGDLISQFKKYNLKEEKDELEYYFSKSSNKRNRATIFELLIKEKADIECEYGRTLTSEAVTESDMYLSDYDKIINALDKYPAIIQSGVKLLDEIYLTKHLGQELTGSYADMVIFTISKIFDQKDIASNIKDFENLKIKLENFKSFDNL